MRLGLFIGLFVFLAGCGTKAEHSGYSRTHTGMEYRLQALGTSDKRVKNGEMVQLAYKYVQERNTTLLDTFWLEWDSTKYDTSWHELTRKLRVGDSASAYLMGINFNKADTINTKLVHVKLLQAIPKLLWHFNKTYPWAAKQISPEERMSIAIELETFESDSIHFAHGVWIIHDVVGFGRATEEGDFIHSKFSGRLLSGIKVDETLPDEPFAYIAGEQDQVIWGMDIALREIREGGKARVLIPSFLAYGKEGSSTGIVGPNEPLFYEVEVIKVERTTEKDL